MVTALGEGGADAILRDASNIDERLALKVGVEEQLFALDEVAEVNEEVGIGLGRDLQIVSRHLQIVSQKLGIVSRILQIVSRILQIVSRNY